jgi:RHS repeat-associated protein
MDNKGVNKGVLENVTQKSDSKVIYEPLDYNARGQLLHYKIANGSIFTTLEFDEYGMPTFIKTGQNIAGASEIQKLETSFNIFTGNLAYRKDHNYMMGGSALQEVFTYDDVFKNSLETWQVDLQTQYSMTVEAETGNILTKSDVTSTGNPYIYSGVDAGPHAVTGITDPLQLPADALQEVKYNLFQKVKQVSNNLGYSLSIKYGPNEQRIKSEYYTPNGSSSVLSQTKFFIGGDYEVEVSPSGSERYLHYLPGGGLFVSHLTPGSDSLNFVLTDYQGTWYKVINENGATVEHYSFDPWGGRRNATDWTYHNVPTSYKFSRGYTGHEMLDAFGLINMNGRVYDPIVARFLSPDAYVQNPEFSHSYNRYSYCFNNPLKYTDPSGMQSIFHGVAGDTPHPNNSDGSQGSQIFIDGMRVYSTAGLFGSGTSGFINREDAFVSGSRTEYLTNGGGGLIASNDGFGWSDLPSTRKVLSNMGFYTNKSSGEMGFYYPSGSTWSNTSYGHNDVGDITGTFSGTVLNVWVSAADLILSVIAGTANPDAMSVGLGADAQVIASSNVSINANVITKGPNAGSGALTCTIGGGVALSSIPLGANAHVDGTKYFYLGNINNFTNQDFEGKFYSSSISLAVEGAYGAITISSSSDNNGALIIGVTYSIGVGLPFGPAGNFSAGKTFNITTWP